MRGKDLPPLVPEFDRRGAFVAARQELLLTFHEWIVALPARDELLKEIDQTLSIAAEMKALAGG